ncbi:glycerol-3-phosphate responsive antiterminator [Cellulosilyticum sp. I15G10I2]|uniref:glycerol-3-phosphate responsive antiterminator n=1 Tax=Cellulosilyticum sp. I15G10I2 TaxID=1892843 RepID=UPI00085CC92A|nr:glycerol-3-phosphate responsive antiterminator [Cellulosilyticum sp. I15G10I2]
MIDFKMLLDENPVIAAVKNESELDKALQTDVGIIFVLFGDILSLKRLSDKIHQEEKIGIIHLDLVEGLSSKEIAIQYIKQGTVFDGIISTKPKLIQAAKSEGLIAVQRIFVLDGISLANAKQHFAPQCDAIEMLPGILFKIIRELCGATRKPLIAGGLIASKEDVIESLKAGAAAISTSKEEIWDM